MQREHAAIVQLANERRQAWLAQTPGAKDHIPALGHIHRAALDGGLVDTSPEYFRFMELQLAALQAQQPEANPVMQPTPKFFQPPPPPAPPKEAHFVSAPVSREVPTSDGRRPRGRVTLKPRRAGSGEDQRSDSGRVRNAEKKIPGNAVGRQLSR